MRRVFFWLVEPLFGGRGFITGHVSPRQLDKRLPETGPTRLPASITTAACLRCCQRQSFGVSSSWAALLYWMNRLPPAEFAEKLGSMSYLQGIATPESRP